ncbi:MAG: hypothetical protein IKV33_04535 [Alistipes sp.]|nr:hypothetical protein [Alistipes sp.]
MRLRFYIYTLAVAILALSCQKQVEPQSIAGYIIDTHDGNHIILHVPDSIPAERSYIIDDNTLFNGGGIVEGNVAEVIYLPTEDGTMPTAQSVTADATYPRMLGRWKTDKDDNLQIDINLQPHGVIVQHAPDGILVFNSWQLTGEENTITLHGSLSLPPKRETEKEKKNKNQDNEEPALPTRQVMQFSVKAHLAFDDEGNTEQHKVLVITSTKGRQSKLYPAWE